MEKMKEEKGRTITEKSRDLTWNTFAGERFENKQNKRENKKEDVPVKSDIENKIKKLELENRIKSARRPRTLQRTKPQKRLLGQ